MQLCNALLFDITSEHSRLSGCKKVGNDNMQMLQEQCKRACMWHEMRHKLMQCCAVQDNAPLETAKHQYCIPSEILIHCVVIDRFMLHRRSCYKLF